MSSRLITEVSLFLSTFFFPRLSFLNCLFVILPIFFPLISLPLSSGCISVGSHVHQTESQLSLLQRSDGLAGHTSGSPWQGSPLPSVLHHPHPLYGADWIEIFRWLLRLLKKQNRYRTKTLRGGLSFISELSRGYTCSCSRAFQHHTATQHLSIIN